MRHTHALGYGLIVASLVACGTRPQNHQDPEPGPCGSIASSPCEGAHDAGSTAPPADAAVRPDAVAQTDAPPGATTPDPVDAAMPPQEDPQCAVATSGLGASGFYARDDAMSVPFSFRMDVSGTLSEGTATGTTPRWFKFVVPSARAVNVSFSGSNAYAAFYFESEATSRFSLGAAVLSKSGVIFDAGTYFVKLGDIVPRYFGEGPTWQLSSTWTIPPAACADGGV